ncbi:methyl-accepting chemotaxis protein [uncultured Pseudodesulfovibrio sp.]|uniref:methyl-accepting chemotaxis protein n=1 Tax=uncultured Pseudodesulfovibrio sp. TaxID=2035858 RepID=UPI0029C68B08|nr:methyl-accepting chemotaxis protein [uncultured Pseudodesulfovibrio sp.]
MTLRQKTLIVTATGILAILLSGIAQFWSMNRINSSWVQYTEQAAAREDLLTEIKEQFGYGGIIHNFKNYVLRGEQKFLDRMNANKKALEQSLAQYNQLQINDEEKKALSVIEAIMQTYVAESATVSTLWDMAAPPQQIDRRVKINDAPAFKAFSVLTEHFENISRDAHEDMASASRLQIIFLIASFILLSAVIVTAVLLLRKQTKSIVSMSQAMAEIEAHSNFSKRMHDGRKDELGMLTNTFDKLLGNIESMLALNRAVLDAVPDPIFLAKDGKVISGNTVAADYAGVHIKDFRGMAADKVLVRAENAPDRGQYTTCLKDGEEVILEEVSTDVTDKTGEIMGCLTVARDVTIIVRREAEAAANLNMIREVGAEINNAAQELVNATGDLSSRIQTISDGAHTQQELSNEAATAMEEMNDSVLDVARNASDVAELAEQARGQAEDGADVVEKSINAISTVNAKAGELKENMGQLGSHTEAIGSIIDVINDIADQTNLLALNAAIEAARAGEAGRGFAVVADEVRKLAEKTVAATKDVSQAIEAIQTVAQQNINNMDNASAAVTEATDLSEKSGEALKAIVELVGGTTRQVASIAAAAEQQSASSEEIMASVSKVSTISDQTADGMRESTSAIKGLTDLAQRLEALAAKAG